MSAQEQTARVAAGAAAGLAGSLGLLLLQLASQRWIPDTMPSYREDPGEFMVREARARLPPAARERITPPVVSAAAQALAAGYGLTAGAAYALLRRHPRVGVADGIAFGLGTWAIGYAGWLPALHLLPSLSRQPPAAALGPAVRHVLFGLLTIMAYRRLGRAMVDHADPRLRNRPSRPA